MLKICKGKGPWGGSLKPLEEECVCVCVWDGGVGVGGDGSNSVEWTQKGFSLGAKS